MTPAAPGEGGASVAKGLLLSLATLLLLFGALAAGELHLRRVDPVSDGERRALEALKWSAGPCYLERTVDGVPSLVENPPLATPELVNRQQAPRHFPLARRPGVRRIAVIGESSANMLENQLAATAARSCGDAVEVLLCSVPGSDLPQTSRRFDEVLRYAPDEVVLVFGHNLYFAQPSDPVAIEAQLLRLRFRLLSWLVETSRMASRARPAEGEALAALTAAFHRFGVEARKKGVALVVTTMASNLRFAPVPDSPPLQNSGPPSPAQSGPSPSEDRLEAELQHELHHDAAAIDRLRDLVRRDDSAELRFLLGSWLYQAGDYAAAREQLLAARDLDKSRIRATTEINRRIREAVADTGAVLRDTEAVVYGGAPHGIAGFETFIDNCHLQAVPLKAEGAAVLTLCAAPCRDLDGKEAEAFATLRTLARSWLSGGGDENRGSDGARLSDPARRTANAVTAGFASMVRQAGNNQGPNAAMWMENLGVFVENWLQADGATAEPVLDRALDDPVLSSLPPDKRARALVHIAEGFHRAGRVEKAQRLNRLARETDARSDDAWLQAGLFALRRGATAEAIAAFEHALTIAPARADAAFFIRRLRAP